jgi:hypothetical protein
VGGKFLIGLYEGFCSFKLDEAFGGEFYFAVRPDKKAAGDRIYVIKRGGEDARAGAKDRVVDFEVGGSSFYQGGTFVRYGQYCELVLADSVSQFNEVGDFSEAGSAPGSPEDD